jgi:hypothetical protein
MADVQDRLVRFARWGEAMREAGILLAVFGPVSIAEIFKSISLATALVIWTASVLLLWMGVEQDVTVERKRRRLTARLLI